jgi:cell division protease FtsH
MLALASASTSYTLNGLSSRRAATAAQPQLTMAASNTNWAAAPLAAALAATTIASAAHAAEPWAYSTLVTNIETDAVAKVVFAPDGLVAVAIDPQGADHAVQLFPEAQLDLVHSLSAHKTPFAVQPTPTKGAVETIAGGLGSLVASLAPTVLLFGGLSFLASRSGMGGMPGGPGGPGAMGKSKSKIQLDADTGVTFADVAGCEGSKQELTEIVEFLKNPTKYSKLGAKIPRGAIMEGPPGTGKTLLARAVAGEAGVPFISASGSEFVEMFVGVGASRVRDLFEQAKQNAPCIVFIDEIDAIGGSRAGGGGGGQSGGNDEREQTLNQILTEMDGFEGNSGVIVLAATNRADTLDAALIRPGRFDRRVPVGLPDVAGRREILNVHVRGKPLSPELDLNIIAKRTTGMSGASLANLMNEAAIVAVRNGRDEIGYAEVDFALDRLQVGMQKSTGMSFPARQRLVAYHEAGHAAMALLTPDYDQVTKVTIIPRTNGAGGFTLFTPSEERLESGMYSKRYLEGQLSVALGGRVAEEIIFGEDDVTTGASSDLQQVRSIARRMVAQWGFGSKGLGGAPVAWEAPEGNGMMGPRAASASTEAAIDAEVQKVVEAAYARCYAALTENQALLDDLAQGMLEHETLDYVQLEAMKEAHLARGEAERAGGAAPSPDLVAA